MPLELGWRLQWERQTESGTSFKLTADAAWCYDLLDNQDSTDTSFRDANAPAFASELERDGRSGAYLNLGAQLKFANGFAAGFTCGALTGSNERRGRPVLPLLIKRHKEQKPRSHESSTGHIGANTACAARL